MFKTGGVTLLLLVGLSPLHVSAVEGGSSNYLPGLYGDIALAVAPANGISIRNDVYHYSGEAGASIRSGLIQAEIDVDVTYNFLSLMHKPGINIFGAQYAYGLTLPYGKTDVKAQLSVGPSTVGREDEEYGLGDIALLPAIFYWNNDNFHYYISQWVVAPTGDYSTSNLANTGLNYWTFVTDFAMTYLNEETGQDYSFVLGYNYNTENDDTSYQSGEEIHIDYALNQFLSEDLSIGIHGFYYKQISDDSGSGALLGDFKGKAAGIGPAVMWIPKQYEGRVAFVAKWINEYNVEKRLDGDHVFMSFMMSF